MLQHDDLSVTYSLIKEINRNWSEEDENQRYNISYKVMENGYMAVFFAKQMTKMFM